MTSCFDNFFFHFRRLKNKTKKEMKNEERMNWNSKNKTKRNERRLNREREKKKKANENLLPAYYSYLFNETAASSTTITLLLSIYFFTMPTKWRTPVNSRPLTVKIPTRETEKQRDRDRETNGDTDRGGRESA